MTSHKILIDTDPGVDDAMAIFYAGLHPDIDIVGMTGVFGNIPVDTATRNALVLADMLGQTIPVARGADAPLIQLPNPVSDYVHGKQGFGDEPAHAPRTAPQDKDAADFIIETARAMRGELILVPIGPLTNIAEALARAPDLPTLIKGVVIMGGGLSRGNVTEFAEANIWNDPHAADAVFAADWPVTMVGLDVTTQVLATPDYFADLGRTAPVLGGFLNRIAQFYMRFYKSNYGIVGAQMHDPTAIVAITDPALFTVETTALEVIVDGERAGQTIRSSDPERRAMSVLMGVQADAVKERFASVIATGH